MPDLIPTLRTVLMQRSACSPAFTTIGVLLTLFTSSTLRAQPAVQPITELRAEVAALRTAEPVEEAVKRLIALDLEMQQRDDVPRSVQQQVLAALAERRTYAALEHLRSIFETQTRRRQDAAWALSLAAAQRPTNDQDWRYLVRSLSVVEGDQAVSVLQALKRFRRAATKPVWIREIILIGLQLPAEDQPVAIALLKFWTGHSVRADTTSGEQLHDWQDWFRRTYPQEPPPELPVDPPQASWTREKLLNLIADLPQDEQTLTAGAAIYVKANCHKCHRRDNVSQQPVDNRLGPDLTTLGWRRQPKEIVTAILYPSHHLNEEYPVTTIILQNGRTVTGLLMPDTDGQLKVIGSDGTETRFAKSDIEESVPSCVSNMPTGLLESLAPHEVRQLLAFLSSQTGEYDQHARE